MIAIVVDSTAALTRAEALRFGVTMVNDTYEVDGVTHEESFLDENGDYDALLAGAGACGTQTAGTEAFRTAFETLTSAGSDVLCVTISSRLAGTYRNACRAADQLPETITRPDGTRAPRPSVAVLDSLSGFTNTEYLVRRARMLEARGMAFADVIDDLVEARTRQGICFSVPSTEPLRSAGRLSMLPQSVTTMLNRYPVLTMRDGAIACVGTARGSEALARTMVAQVPAGTRDLTLAHYGARNALTVELLRAARESFPRARIRVKDGGPVLTINLGRGAASVAWAPADEEGRAGEA